MYTLHTHYCTFGADLQAQSVLSNKISASEVSRNFIKSALLVWVDAGSLKKDGFFGRGGGRRPRGTTNCQSHCCQKELFLSVQASLKGWLEVERRSTRQRKRERNREREGDWP